MFSLEFYAANKLDSIANERKLIDCYKKTSYAGNSVRICNTKLYVPLTLCNKYMVKNRVEDASGITGVKLSVKTFESSRLVLLFKKPNYPCPNLTRNPQSIVKSYTIH